MKFRCPKCKKIFKRDMRLKIAKNFLTKAGNYTAYCSKVGQIVRCRRVK